MFEVIFCASSANFGSVCANSLLTSNSLPREDIIPFVDLTVFATFSAFSVSSCKEVCGELGSDLYY